RGIDAGHRYAMPGSLPDRGAGPAADIDRPVSGGQPCLADDSPRDRSPARRHRQRGEQLNNWPYAGLVAGRGNDLWRRLSHVWRLLWPIWTSRNRIGIEL